MDEKAYLEEGRAVLGMELGSTRIKAVVTDECGRVLAEGGHSWENRFENGFWTYSLEDVISGIQSCYQDLLRDIKERYDAEITSFAAMGFSAMMHGYLAFDKEGALLAPFRTWRNTVTEEASKILTEEFQYNIPQRWSISHLYQAILRKEPHVEKVAFLTTLAGYVHYLLTGEKVLGVGDASGMFPIDSKTGDYRADLAEKFEQLAAKKGFYQKLTDILPAVLPAGKPAGTLTQEGARLLDISGRLKPGIMLCPPEGDAGTGMVATNSITKRTGNVSAGTSVFAMVVLEKDLSRIYPEIDLVTTPDGAPVGMVHCNNCTSDINAWVGLFEEFAGACGIHTDKSALFSMLYQKALEGDADCGGLLSYNYFSGEPVTGFDEGAVLFARSNESKFSLANVMRMHLYSALASLKIGMDLLLKEEKVGVDVLLGHGGYFKTKHAGGQIAADALGVPISVMETAGEGGAFGMAVLAAYAAYYAKQHNGTLSRYLQEVIFAQADVETFCPVPENTAGFAAFMERYKAGFAMEREAVKIGGLFHAGRTEK